MSALLSPAEFSEHDVVVALSDRAARAQLSGDSRGRRLRRLRLKRGLTMAHVAEALGVSRPTVWAWEKGRSRPHPSRIAALAATLGIDPDELDDASLSDGDVANVIEECRQRIAAACGTGAAAVRILVEL
jgi:transcriptional regulator with XRE-family HTH domain